jgi:hypothetical protein
MRKHITILTSPTGEEFYESYGPMTKDRTKATEFHTNPATLQPPSRFGVGAVAPFWDCEIRAAERARKEFRGWKHRHVKIN